MEEYLCRDTSTLMHEYILNHTYCLCRDETKKKININNVHLILTLKIQFLNSRYLPKRLTDFTSCQGIAGNAFSCTGKIVINEKKCNSPCLIGELARHQYFWENVKSDMWAPSFCLECGSQTCFHRQTDTTLITRFFYWCQAEIINRSPGEGR